MSTQKLNATQKKLLEIIEKSEETAKQLKDKQPFDFACINDYCPDRKDSRAKGIAWKCKNNLYGFYCFVCGQDEKLTKNEFKEVKKKLTKEQAHQNMELERKKRESRKKSKAA